jgi:hypothetical protein
MAVDGPQGSVRISARLRVAAFIPEGSVAADIGTDHALLAAHLVATGRSPRVIATDANASPLAVARRALERWPAAAAVELRLGHGLRVLRPGEADVLELAGLGGDTIADLLGDRPEVAAAARRLVLQPARSAHRPRQDGVGCRERSEAGVGGAWMEPSRGPSGEAPRSARAELFLRGVCACCGCAT